MHANSQTSPALKQTEWQFFSTPPFLSDLSLVSTSGTAVGDVVVILRSSSNREDSPRLLGQRDCSHSDLQRWESIQRDGGPIAGLFKSGQRSAMSAFKKNELDTKRAYRLDAPVEIALEIRCDDTGIE